MSLLQVRDLNVWYSLGEGGENHAVRDLSFSLNPGQRLGLVGESGCGKTTALLALMALLPPTASVSGEVLFEGENLPSTKTSPGGTAGETSPWFSRGR